MAPILVVVGLLILGVAIVAWSTRHTTSRPYARRRDQDTAWNDPMTPAPAGRATAAPLYPAQPDAFARGPEMTPLVVVEREPAPFGASAAASDPFAHAPARADPKTRP